MTGAEKQRLLHYLEEAWAERTFKWKPFCSKDSSTE